MEHAPQATVDMWKAICATRGNRVLDPKKLIPALVQYRVVKLRPGQVSESEGRVPCCFLVLKFLITLRINFFKKTKVLWCGKCDETSHINGSGALPNIP